MDHAFVPIRTHLRQEYIVFIENASLEARAK